MRERKWAIMATSLLLRPVISRVLSSGKWIGSKLTCCRKNLSALASILSLRSSRVAATNLIYSKTTPSSFSTTSRSRREDMVPLGGHKSSHRMHSSMKPSRSRECKCTGKLKAGGGDEPIHRACRCRLSNKGKEQTRSTASAQVGKVMRRSKCRRDMKLDRNKARHSAVSNTFSATSSKCVRFDSRTRTGMTWLSEEGSALD